MSTYLVVYIMIIDLPFSSIKKKLKKLIFPNDRIGNHKVVGLPTCKPLWLAVAHLLRWHTCSETKSFNNGSRLPVWSPDQQSCPFIKYNCLPHTYPFRLLFPKPQTYPSVNMSKITACLYTRVIVTKLPVYPHKHFLAILHGALQTCLYIYASPYTQIF